MVLIILTYALMIFGTFLTRSGVLSSVHAFARSDIGPLFFVYIAITSLLCLGLLVWRWNTLKSEVELTALLSRESFFLLNNLFFMGILIVCFVGVVFPIFSELITGVQVTMGAPYYKTATGPLFAALLLLMGIVPLTAWGRSTYKTLRKTIWKPLTLSLLVPVVLVAAGMRSWGALLALWLVSFTDFVTLYDYGRSVGARMHAAHEGPLVAFWRLGGKNRRRFGGYIIHLGVVLMAVGIIGMEFFQTQTQGTLKRGESLQLGSYSLTLTDIKAFDTSDGRNVVRAEISAEKGDSLLGMLYPRRDLYSTEQQTMTVPAIYSTLEGDLYVVLADWEQLTADSATFKVYYNPLINWLWIGALVFCLGTLVAVWPDPLRKETVGE
jgi:cytochrome c-type biogenesis protein CcmF